MPIDITNLSKEQIVDAYEKTVSGLTSAYEKQSLAMEERIKHHSDYYLERTKHYRDIVVKIIEYSSLNLSPNERPPNVVKKISEALAPVAYHSIKGNYTEEEYKLIATQILAFIDKAEAFERLLNAIAENDQVAELWSQLTVLAKLTED